MPIPTYYYITLELLKLLNDQEVYRLRDLVEKLAQLFNLTEEEKDQLLPSGRDKLFKNRVHWARFYLMKALLVESPMRGHLKITPRGLEVLKQSPERIDVKFLYLFKEFKEYRERIKGKADEISEEKSEQTPTEALQEAFETIKSELAEDLLDQVNKVNPDFFEKLVLDLLKNMGYGGLSEDSIKKVGQSHDEGIDGIIKEDKLGLDTIYIQAKKWENTVGRPEIQKFAGALEGKRAKKGVFITTSNFSKGALDYVSNINKKIVLIDGPQLARYMIEHNVAVFIDEIYEIKRIDTDYFEED